MLCWLLRLAFACDHDVELLTADAVVVAKSAACNHTVHALLLAKQANGFPPHLAFETTGNELSFYQLCAARLSLPLSGHHEPT